MTEKPDSEPTRRRQSRRPGHFRTWTTKSRTGTTQYPNRVRILRMLQGMSQRQLAELVGITQATLHLIEIGQTKDPGIEKAKRIAAALGSPVLDVFSPCDYEIIRKKLVSTSSEFEDKKAQV